MIIIPAIDIKDNKFVRLVQGNFGNETIYGDNPVAIAKKWQNLGAEYIHIVDLDGAKTGKQANNETIKKIVKEIDIPVELGGGIRNLDSVKNNLDLGIDRVIIGTAAINDKNFLKQAVKLYGNRICVSLDAKDGKIAIEGWQKISKLDAFDYIEDLINIGVETIVYTDISKDGMLSGPNFKIYEKIVAKFNINVIASGGMSSIDDLKKLNEIGVYGAIIGKALYDKKIDLREAVKCLQKE